MMQKQARKIQHEVASAYGIATHSFGAEPNRHLQVFKARARPSPLSSPPFPVDTTVVPSPSVHTYFAPPASNLCTCVHHAPPGLLPQTATRCLQHIRSSQGAMPARCSVWTLLCSSVTDALRCQLNGCQGDGCRGALFLIGRAGGGRINTTGPAVGRGGCAVPG